MSEETFTYRDVELPYLTHLYNITYLTERRVEIPIATHWLRNKEPSEGLEVGNVLGHYERRTHDVVDRDEPPAWYQTEQAVHAIDLFDLKGDAPLRDWVVSLSTVEHTADPAGAIGVLFCLAPRGLVTFPTGIDPGLDKWLEDGAPGTWDTVTLARIGNGSWAQTPLPQVRPYGPWANAVAVLEWDRT